MVTHVVVAVVAVAVAAVAISHRSSNKIGHSRRRSASSSGSLVVIVVARLSGMNRTPESKALAKA